MAISSASLFDSISQFKVLSEYEMTSDHIPTAFELRNGKSNKIEVDPQVPVTRDIFNYNKANWELFKSHLPNCAPTEIQDDVGKLNDFVINGLLNAVNLSIPKK